MKQAHDGLEHAVHIERRKTKAAKRTKPTRRYDEDVLTVNWIPATALIAGSCNQIEQGLPQDLMGLDVDALLDRLYALA